MERQHIETALQAANVALTGRRERQASSFASIELREEEDPRRGRWEVIATFVVGAAAVIAVLVAWLY